MRNGPQSFGWPTRALHWIMAAGILFMLPLGTYIANMEVSLSSLWLFALHKSIGITLLAALVIRIAWHRMSPPPAPVAAGVPAWQLTAARAAHRALYLLMLLVPVSGWIASGATGLPVQAWGVTLPSLAPVSEPLENAVFTVHSVLTKLLFLTVVLHIAGALHRQFSRRDGTLTRMIRGSAEV